jgi:hypothetical protein
MDALPSFFQTGTLKGVIGQAGLTLEEFLRKP